jgi:hypothetical protein
MGLHMLTMGSARPSEYPNQAQNRGGTDKNVIFLNGPKIYSE